MTTLRINWSAYYVEFSRTHGGDPVLYKQDKDTGKGGYFLFRDGWMYSAASYTGPEYPPLDDEDCVYKIRQYWTIRMRVLELELREMKDDALQLARLQDSRSAAMLHDRLGVVSTTVTETEEADDTGRRTSKQKIVSVDLDWMIAKIQDLTSEVAQCHRELVKIEPPPPEQPKTNEALVQAEIELLSLRAERGTL